MRGLLIYDATGAERNDWFIEHLISTFSNKNIDLKLIVLHSDTQKIETTNIDFAIVRTIAPQLNKQLEEENIRVFNNSKTSFVANDKWKTYLMCQKLNISTMETFHHQESTSHKSFPCVVKSCNGHGGREVFWANSHDDLLKITNRLESACKDFVVQKPCSTLGKDMRIYTLGNKIITSVLRYNSNDFRSNYSLGGKVERTTPSEYQIDVVKKIVDYLNSDYIGVDFIYNNEKWVVNEIEDVVGARMLYATTNIDIASEYCDYIEKEMLTKHQQNQR